MPRRQHEPLRPLTPVEYTRLEHLSRSRSACAAQVAQAKALLAVAAGQRFTEARAAGRRSGDAVAQLVVASFLQQTAQHQGISTYRPPRIILDKEFVQVPRISGPGTAPADFRCLERPDLRAPATGALVGDDDSPFAHRFLHTPPAKREPVVDAPAVGDDLSWIATLAVGRIERIYGRMLSQFLPSCRFAALM
jgi:hypothetical protein